MNRICSHVGNPTVLSKPESSIREKLWFSPNCPVTRSIITSINMSSEKYSVIFLVNKFPPDKVLLLKRAETQKFAPGFYTGIGGKIGDFPEVRMESRLEGAYRELREETGGDLTEENIRLIEFARCVYEKGTRLFYFVALSSKDRLPVINPSDGALFWVDVDELLNKDIIPTTKVICEEWARRNFLVDIPFTLIVREIGIEKTVRLVEVLKVQEGLL